MAGKRIWYARIIQKIALEQWFSTWKARNTKGAQGISNGEGAQLQKNVNESIYRIKNYVYDVPTDEFNFVWS